MKLIIDSDACLKNGTCIGEVLLLYEYVFKVNPEGLKQPLIDKGYITNAGDLFGRYKITEKAMNLLNNVLADSSVDDDTKITELATQLKEMYPKGKKEGTNQFWTDGISLIVKRLNELGITEDQIVTMFNNLIHNNELIQGVNNDD